MEIKSLDIANFDYLRETPDLKEKWTLQVFEFSKNQQGQISKVQLSDGYEYQTFYIHTSIWVKFEQEIFLGSVIESLVCFNKQKSIYILIDYKIVQQKCNIIDNPIKHEINNNIAKTQKKLIPQEQKSSKNWFEQLKVEDVDETYQNTYDSFDKIQLPMKQFAFKGRIKQKNQLKEYTYKGKPGKVFSIILFDQSSEILVTFFNDMAEVYFKQLEKDQVIVIRNGQLKHRSKENPTKNQIELNVNMSTKIQRIINDQQIPKKVYNFVTIKQIKELQDWSFIDVVGYVQEISQINEVIIKQSETWKNIKVLLRDETNSIQLTFWEHEIEKINFKAGDIIILQQVLVRSFSGRALTITKQTEITADNKDMQQFQQLKEFFSQEENKNKTVPCLTQIVQQEHEQLEHLFSIREIKEQSQNLLFQNQEQNVMLSTIAYFLKIQDNPFYMACTNDFCWKKVDFNKDQKAYICNKCHLKIQEPIPWFFGKIKFLDETDNIECLIAGENLSQMMFQLSEEKLYSIFNEEKFIKTVNEKMYKQYKLQISCRSEIYEEMKTVWYNIRSIFLLNESLEKLNEQLLTENNN